MRCGSTHLYSQYTGREVGGSKSQGHPELYSRERTDKIICFAGSKSKPGVCFFSSFFIVKLRLTVKNEVKHANLIMILRF